MKKISLFAICLVTLTGCVNSYSSVQVGPDRYAVTSRGNEHGPTEWANLLQRSYKTCLDHGYKDFKLVTQARADSEVVFFVSCVDNKSTEPKEQKTATQSNANGLADLEKYYNDTKTKILETLK